MQLIPTLNLETYREDFEGFAALLDIIPKGGIRQKLYPLNRIQKKYCAARTPRDVVLKPRQIGFSTLELARDIWFFLTRPGARVVVVVQSMTTHEAAKSVSTTMRTMLDGLVREGATLDFRTDSASEWTLGDRSLRIIEAGASEAAATKKGRGGTISRLHFTESAFYEYAEETLNAVLECVPGPDFGTEIVSESTPNGAGGVFHEQYIGAAAGRSGYAAHFFPWFEQEEYRTELDPGEVVKPETAPERAQLLRKPDLEPEQLKWYRQKIAEKRGNSDLVAQEYPTDPETAFLVRGGSFFCRDATTALLHKAREPIAVEMAGALRVWARAEPGVRYVVAADPSEGTGGDPGAAGVYRRDNGDHVATLHGQFQTWRFGELLSDVGHAYNDAMLVVERNNHGHAVLQSLQYSAADRTPYRNIYSARDEKLGWLSTETSRASALEALESAIRKGEWSTPDRKTLGELFTFVINPRSGKAEAAPGSHDDLVIMAAIAHDILIRARPLRLVSTPPKAQYRFAGGGRGF